MAGQYNPLSTFWLHLRPKRVRRSTVRFTYTWGLGGTAAVLILLLMTTGVLLKFVYQPMPDRAYDAIVALQTSVGFGAFIRNIHHWSANLLIVAVFGHMLRVFYTGAFQGQRRLNWVVGTVLLLTVLGSNFTGYLLPWDQLAYWAVTICLSTLAYLPWIGDWLQRLIVGGESLGPETLSNFFALHTAVFPVVLLLLLPFHFWRIRKAGGLAARPSGQEATAAKEQRIDVMPDLLVRELAAAAAVVALVMLMAALWDAPLGARANPGLSPNPTKAPWYFAGLQELLLHLHPTLAVAVIPLIAILGMILLPFLPYPAGTSGYWFGSRSGCRLTVACAIGAVILTWAWVIGHAQGASSLAVAAPLAAIVMVAGIFWVSRYSLGADTRESVQAGFTFVITVFIVFTIIGIWFRGESMMLVWPWQ